ncbi:MAG: PA14 domain-containing protein, partial [Planctomycetota bacterium]
TGNGHDIWDSSDNFHYAYVPLIGDGEITARVVDNGSGSNSWSKGGVMIRETLDGPSRHTFMAVTGGDGGGICFQGRPDTGSGSISFHGDVTASPPHWVKLVREGDMITGYHSDDGVAWEEFTDGSPDGAMTNPMDQPLPEQVYIGLAVSSHAAGELRTWTFDNVTVGLPVIAYGPSPADGTIHSETWASMGWNPGHTAVSHDVYFGDNAADVEAGTGDTFQGNQDADSLYFVVGFPGYPYPDGLINGQTYYWRIDEVEADGTIQKGYVWSFTIPSKKAYDPVPSDGSKFIDADNVNLTWTPGFEAVLHTVYFGDDYDTVANASGGMPGGPTTFNPGPLELEKTYYWRVDEFEQAGTHTGDVWSFTTAKDGGGLRADYYNGMNFETLMLTRTDPEVDFGWGNGGPDASVGDDQYSARWTGEVEAVFTETYTFYTSSDDGTRLWVNGQQLIDDWTDHGVQENSGTIELEAGNTYSLVLEFYENGGGSVVRLLWSSDSTPKQIIPQAALSPPIKASSPSPSNGATGTKMTPILRWGVGDFAASHEVYFGTDADAVKNADKSSPEYKGPKALGEEIYDPGKLAWHTQYFWRIDEVNNLNPESPWIGNLWSFTTGDFLVVDDFEDYNIGDNEIWFAWNDGLGAGAPGTPGYVAPNGTGSMIGDDTTNSYTEETIVHGGNQSMPYWYNNQQSLNKYSEAKLTLTAPRDWTEEGVTRLSLWFRGYPPSTGSFVESPAGTYTMAGSGWDIEGSADGFHYAYKTLNGIGSIQARVLSMDHSHDWSKAGVMIRETLDPGSMQAMMVVTPAQGVSFQRRFATDDTTSNTTTGGIVAPHWVKIERDITGNFTGYSSADGSTWEMIGTENIPMGSNVYIGLAVTSHDVALTCQAVFTNVTTSGNVGTLWSNQDIGIESNDPEPLYVAVSNSNGTTAVEYHDNPDAATIDAWTEWVIPLSAFADKG